MPRLWRLWAALAIAALLLITNWRGIADDLGDKNLYARQAQTFLVGRLDIHIPDFSQRHWRYDLAFVDGRYFMPFPPGPVLFALPAVAAFDLLAARMSLIAVGVSLLTVCALWRLLGALGMRPERQLWLAGAFVFGTAYWLAVRLSGGAWYFAHVAAVAFLMLALAEAHTRGAGLLTGLFLGLAFLSRQLTVCAALYLLAVLWMRAQPEGWAARARRLGGFALGFGLCAAFYLWFNQVRFGSPLATGYDLLPLEGALRDRAERYGLFNLAYVPFNLVYMFLQGPHLGFGGDLDLRLTGLDPYGTSLTFASPFVFAALAARLPKLQSAMLWLSVIAIIGNLMFYYNNGSAQWNAQRYTLDFLPLLLVPLAQVFEQAAGGGWRLLRGAVLYAGGLNILAWALG